MVKCPPANLCLHLARSQKSKEQLTSKNSACDHTLLNLKKTTKVLVTYGRNSMSDLTSSNDVAIYNVNGRIGNAKPGANLNAVPRWKLAWKVAVA